MSRANPAGRPLMRRKRSSEIGGRLTGGFCLVRTQEARMRPMVPVRIAMAKIVLNEK